jgi:hypothetical protein
MDVVVEYDDQNPVASDYALRCERDAPTRWQQAVRPAVAEPPTSNDPLPDAARR